MFLSCPILVLLVNTFAADEKYHILNRDNLTIPFQMRLSQKQKNFANFFAAFLKSIINCKYFVIKMTLIDLAFPKLLTSENVVT